MKYKLVLMKRVYRIHYFNSDTEAWNTLRNN